MLTLRHLRDSFEKNLELMVGAGVNEPSTLRWYRDVLKKLDPLDAVPADSLRAHHLATIPFTNAFVRALKCLYKWGVTEDLVPRDPFAKLTIPPCGQRERVLSRQELGALYRASPPAFRRLLYVQVNSLARPGEIRGLTWDQIDWKQRVILIVKYKGKKLRRDKLKARAIPLPLPVLRLLKNLHRKAKDPAGGRVFIAPRGKPWTPNGVRCAMRRARLAAKLDGGGERVVCYTLRHTSATKAVRKDLNLKLVAEIMGHARTTTTERYVHLNTSDLVAGIDRVAARPRRSDPAAVEAPNPKRVG